MVEGEGERSTGGVPEGEERRSQGTKVVFHLFHRLPMTEDLERRGEREKREGGREGERGGGGGGGSGEREGAR